MKISHLKNGTYGLTGNITIKQDLPNTATVSVRLLKKNSAGVWTSGLLMASPDINICSYVKVDTILYPVVARHSSLPEQCPFPKGNYVFNSSDWNAPTAFGTEGCFKVIFSIKNKRKPIICVSIVAKLVGAKGSRLPRCV
ncbi:hypothetical protein LSTR_LSTR005174 [Laodelphax striatellus]|uniref:MD-2-related lipid-recognition domain-containing protein n=1 Tax=Laodelphax striatellus TaxID=195883 RepID=A0A482XMH1_LAOST|nr:hypothetical protein LSTR_LSTR005174 [Laodelphax striatellus]